MFIRFRYGLLPSARLMQIQKSRFTVNRPLRKRFVVCMIPEESRKYWMQPTGACAELESTRLN